jgi:hypothetical protein
MEPWKPQWNKPKSMDPMKHLRGHLSQKASSNLTYGTRNPSHKDMIGTN